MTIEEARKIENDFYENTNPDADDEFMYIEAMDFLINELKNPKDMLSLGGVYYGKKKYDLALKYYELSASYDYEPAYGCLGYIWYYGRTGTKDYKKAFEYFSKSSKKGNIISSYKIADMYKNGYYVEKNQAKYEQIIEELYPKIMNAKYLDDPLPEIYTRLARIRQEQGKIEDAIMLYEDARPFLAQRIKYNPFFGNRNIMKWLIDDLYRLREFDEDDFELYDLYYVLLTPHRVRFHLDGKEYIVESIMEDGQCVIKFGDKWFKDRDAFFEKAQINGELLTTLYFDLDWFELVKD